MLFGFELYKIIKFLARKICAHTRVSLMSRELSVYKTHRTPGLFKNAVGPEKQKTDLGLGLGRNPQTGFCSVRIYHA